MTIDPLQQPPNHLSRCGEDEPAPHGVTLAAIVVGRPTGSVSALSIAILVILAGQLIVIQPRLNRRTDRVLGGHNPPRSTMHLYYVGFEAAKVLTLVALGICLLVAR